MVDAWPFKLEYRHAGLHRQISLHSTERLNMIVTPAAFRSLGDVRSFFLLLQAAQPSRNLPRVAVRAMGSWLGLARGRVTTLYRWVVHACCSGRNDMSSSCKGWLAGPGSRRGRSAMHEYDAAAGW